MSPLGNVSSPAAAGARGGGGPSWHIPRSLRLARDPLPMLPFSPVGLTRGRHPVPHGLGGLVARGAAAAPTCPPRHPQCSLPLRAPRLPAPTPACFLAHRPCRPLPPPATAAGVRPAGLPGGPAGGQAVFSVARRHCGPPGRPNRRAHPHCRPVSGREWGAAAGSWGTIRTWQLPRLPRPHEEPAGVGPCQPCPALPPCRAAPPSPRPPASTRCPLPRHRPLGLRAHFVVCFLLLAACSPPRAPCPAPTAPRPAPTPPPQARHQPPAARWAACAGRSHRRAGTSSMQRARPRLRRLPPLTPLGALPLLPSPARRPCYLPGRQLSACPGLLPV